MCGLISGQPDRRGDDRRAVRRSCEKAGPADRAAHSDDPQRRPRAVHLDRAHPASPHMRSHWPTSSFLTTWSAPAASIRRCSAARPSARVSRRTWALANSWIIINVGGGPTDDKPAVTLETPRDPDLASSFLNIRVPDIQAVYAEWSARGAEFLTPPKQHKTEIRCYMRDPDGHLRMTGCAGQINGHSPSAAIFILWPRRWV
jgi:hypothetical protein